MAELSQIVSLLNEAPFKLNLTMVQMDTHPFSEVLRIVAKVCHFIDETQTNQMNIDQLNTEILSDKVLNFIKLLNYQPSLNEQFGTQLKAGNNKELLYQLLHWMLTGFEQRKTRAYVGRFLKSFDMPQEFFIDPMLSDLYSQLQAQQQLFKDTHQKFTQTISESEPIPIDATKKEIRQLRHEKEQLHQKLNQMQIKIDNEPSVSNDRTRFQQTLETTSSLRKLSEEETILFERAHEQRNAHRFNQKRIQQLELERYNLQNMISASELNSPTNHGNNGSIAPISLVEKLSIQIDESENELLKIDAEYKEEQQLLQQMWNTVHSDPVSDHQLNVWQSQITELASEIEELQSERDRLLQAVDSKLGLYKKRALDVANKKESAQNRLEQSQDEAHDIRTDILQLEEAMDKMSVNGRRPLSESELKQYMNILRQKTAHYQQCKDSLQSQRNELGVLERTLEIIQSKDENLDDYYTKKEQKKKSSGKRNSGRRYGIEDDSDTKEDTIMTQESIKSSIRQLSAAIKQKRNALTPLIRKLKQRREANNEFEKDYLSKRRTYEGMRAGYDSEINGLQQSVDTNKKALQHLNNKSGQMENDIQSKKARFVRVKDEKLYQSGTITLSREFSSWRDQYKHEINKLSQQSKQLRNEQKIITDRYDSDLEQKTYFVKLKQLLDLKLNIVQKNVDQTTMDRNDDDLDGADRMILID